MNKIEEVPGWSMWEDLELQIKNEIALGLRDVLWDELMADVGAHVENKLKEQLFILLAEQLADLDDLS